MQSVLDCVCTGGMAQGVSHGDTAIFKKGGVAECGNYRPISSLSIGCKLYAAMLLAWLKSAGVESRVWDTHFGFRSGTGTADALFVARRLIEDTVDTASGKLLLLALGWAT